MPHAGIVFDCDGTLVDTETTWSMAERATLERYDAQWSPDLEGRFVGLTTHQTASLIAELAEVPHHERDGVHSVLTSTFEDLIEAGHAQPTTGAEDLLRELTDRAVPVGVVSNSPRRLVTAVLERTRLLHWVDVLLCADDGLPAKPAPDLYVNACAQLRVEPTASVAFEDAQTGLDAARGAGLYAVAVPAPVATPGAHLRVESLAGLDVPALMAAARHRTAGACGA